jgi:hypothetical protein
MANWEGVSDVFMIVLKELPWWIVTQKGFLQLFHITLEPSALDKLKKLNIKEEHETFSYFDYFSLLAVYLCAGGSLLDYENGMTVINQNTIRGNYTDFMDVFDSLIGCMNLVIGDSKEGGVTLEGSSVGSVLSASGIASAKGSRKRNLSVNKDECRRPEGSDCKDYGKAGVKRRKLPSGAIHTKRKRV